MAFLSDGLPIFGYRRRPYLILSGILGAASWITLATVVDTAWAATATILVSSLSVAISDVIVDSLVVERARQESLGKAGSLQSLTWGGFRLRRTDHSIPERFCFSNTLAAKTVFCDYCHFFPCLFSGVAWLIAEESIGDSNSVAGVRSQIKQLRGAIAQKSIWLPTAFIFIWQATPTADSALFFFTTNELGFQPEFLGRVRPSN